MISKETFGERYIRELWIDSEIEQRF